MISTCNICVEDITSTRYCIPCSFCDFEACNICWKTYFLEHSECICMSCKKTWTRKYTSKKFDKKFLNVTFKKQRENLLFEKEKALLPATQPIVETEIRVEEIDNELKKLRKAINKLKSRVGELNREKYRIRNNTNSKTESSRVFIRACSNSDCRGFLNQDWSCSLCNRKTCKECFEQDEEDHKCDPNSVSTAKLLARDTKPCPNCGTQIFKIEGCDQMYCTQCHTPFSWKTGAIEKGVIHNPHYFEYIRNNPNSQYQNPNFQQCGREIDNRFINILRGVLDNSIGTNSVKNLIFSRCRNIIHIREIELPKFRVDRLRNNQDLRVKYLQKELTEEQFKKTLQKREKDIAKRTELYDILQLLVISGTDILYNVINQSNSYTYSLVDCEKELSALIDYINTELTEICSVYSCVQYTITDNMKLNRS